MNVRTLAAAAALALVVIPGAMARDLTIIVRDDLDPEAQGNAYFRPFTEATGIRLDVQNWSGGIDALRAKKDPAGTLAPLGKRQRFESPCQRPPRLGNHCQARSITSCKRG